MSEEVRDRLEAQFQHLIGMGLKEDIARAVVGLYERGRIDIGELDNDVIMALKDASSVVSIQVLIAFEKSVISGVNYKSAYLCALAKNALETQRACHGCGCVSGAQSFAEVQAHTKAVQKAIPRKNEISSEGIICGERDGFEGDHLMHGRSSLRGSHPIHGTPVSGSQHQNGGYNKRWNRQWDERWDGQQKRPLLPDPIPTRPLLPDPIPTRRPLLPDPIPTRPLLPDPIPSCPLLLSDGDGNDWPFFNRHHHNPSVNCRTKSFSPGSMVDNYKIPLFPHNRVPSKENSFDPSKSSFTPTENGSTGLPSETLRNGKSCEGCRTNVVFDPAFLDKMKELEEELLKFAKNPFQDGYISDVSVD